MGANDHTDETVLAVSDRVSSGLEIARFRPNHRHRPPGSPAAFRPSMTPPPTYTRGRKRSDFRERSLPSTRPTAKATAAAIAKSQARRVDS